MTPIVVAVIGLVVALGALLYGQRTWLTLADTERSLGRGAESLAASPYVEDPTKWQRAAREHRDRAAKFERRAWPWKPRSRRTET